MSHRVKNSFKFIPFWQQFLATFGFCTLVAALLFSVNQNIGFMHQYILSLSIGFSVHLTCIIFFQVFNISGWLFILPLSIGAVLGVFIGNIINGINTGYTIEKNVEVFFTNFDLFFHSMGFAFFFSVIILYILSNRERTLRAEAKLRDEQFEKLDIQKQIAETKLRLLQAQIEPHFLFNSLSNIISLIDADPDKSKYLLDKLSIFLRSTLSRSYNEKSSLRDEVNLISNYMDIFKVRMENRLNYEIEVPEEFLDIYLPPMLLQPIVENAIKHGIEPLPEGGSIIIKIDKFGDKLRLSVIDTGIGFEGETSSGFGLLNVRQRLKSLYGDEAKLIIAENDPTGSQVTIEIPYA